MFRTALRTVLAHKLRLLMTMLAVLLGVAFVAGTLVFTATMDKGLRDSSSKDYAGISVAVTTTGASARDADQGKRPDGVSDALLGRLGRLDGVASAQPVLTGFTGVADAKHNLIGGSSFGTYGGNYAPVGAGHTDPRYHFTSGAAPTGAGQVALDAKTAKDGGYRVGDTVDVAVTGPVMHEKLAGIFTTQDGNVASGGTLTLFDTATAQKLFLAPGLSGGVNLRAAPGTSQQQLLDRVNTAIKGQSGLEAKTAQQLIDDQAKQISAGMSTMNTIFLSFAGVALFVGIFLIANTFTMLVAQRTRELALLRAIGASRRQVTRSVLIEAVIVGVVSSVVGYLVGLGLSLGMRSLISSNGGNLPNNPLVITPTSVISALAVGIVITVLSAWLPARRAAKIPPVAAMSSSDAPPKQRSLIVRNAIGAFFVAVGGALIALGLHSSGSTGQKALTLGGGAAVGLVGIIVLTPLISRPVIGAFTPLLSMFGVSGRLAKRNSLRNPRRTAATATALMIGLTLMSALGVVVTSLKSGIAAAATDGIRADYSISNANFTPMDQSVVAKVKQVPGIAAASGTERADVTIDGKQPEVNAMDTTVLSQLFHVDRISGTVGALSPSQIAVSDKTAAKEHWRTGQSVTVKLPDGSSRQAVVSGTYKGGPGLPATMVDRTMLSGHTFKEPVERVFVKAAPGKAGSALKSDIKEALGNSPIVQVQTRDDLLNSFNTQIDQVLYMVYGLLGMSVVVAVIGVVNTMAMSVFERSREIGMLRAIGLDRRRVKRMVRLESLVISVFGALLGMGAGTFLAWAAGRLIKPSFATYAMKVPWSQYGIFFGAALVVGVLAALWPARRAARLNALEAIKSD
ncbi:hypothetical protein BIV57_03660 [Mangrovactinospora gilvigrisea]|uniref:ABC transporter n=1 Tax=Mangrovactinospora gilvigrisea TaxID=1428644 RepID=A0A1J7BJS9_9ACTN|nr:ABC transporter permease [Mangrovactinospora gilvigrisea]OIV38845.1 hypothetical protein BIV57_03660 [Mangrovactinospora gilvigrisea]